MGRKRGAESFPEGWTGAAHRQGALTFPAAPGRAPDRDRRIPPVPAGSQLIMDLETKIGIDQIRGRAKIREMGISVAVTYAYADDRFRTYCEDDAPLLIEDLFGASRTIGFNVRRFDYEVLRGYTRRPLGKLPTLDLLDEVEREAGHRISLGSLLQETLRISKAGDGGMAIGWYRNGDWKRLEKYCR